MNMFREKLLASTLDTLYQCVTDEEQWPAALGDLSRLFDAPRLSISRTTPALDGLYELRALNHDAETQRLYQEHYWRIDPTHGITRDAPVGKWLDCRAVLDPRITPEPEYVNDYAIKRGIRWVSGGKIHADLTSCTFLGLQRASADGPFDLDSQQLFEQLAPHLRRVAVLTADLQSVRVGKQLAKAALDGFDRAAYVVSAGGALLLANDEGERQLARAIPCCLKAGKLCVSEPNLQLRFAEAIKLACTNGTRRATALTVGSGAGWGASWMLRVVPMPADAERSVGVASALVYAAPSHPTPAPEAVLRELFSLSAAEAEIAFLLGDGLTVKEIAFTRQVSDVTIRSQIRQIFAKTGVRRQSQLAQLLFAIPRLNSDS